MGAGLTASGLGSVGVCLSGSGLFSGVGMVGEGKGWTSGLGAGLPSCRKSGLGDGDASALASTAGEGCGSSGVGEGWGSSSSGSGTGSSTTYGDGSAGLG